MATVPVFAVRQTTRPAPPPDYTFVLHFDPVSRRASPSLCKANPSASQRCPPGPSARSARTEDSHPLRRDRGLTAVTRFPTASSIADHGQNYCPQAGILHGIVGLIEAWFVEGQS